MAPRSVLNTGWLVGHCKQNHCPKTALTHGKLNHLADQSLQLNKLLGRNGSHLLQPTAVLIAGPQLWTWQAAHLSNLRDSAAEPLVLQLAPRCPLIQSEPVMALVPPSNLNIIGDSTGETTTLIHFGSTIK